MNERQMIKIIEDVLAEKSAEFFEKYKDNLKSEEARSEANYLAMWKMYVQLKKDYMEAENE